MNNVYDILGNGYESTLESSNTVYRQCRSGGYGPYAPCRRNDGDLTYVNSNYSSSRLALIIK